MPTKLVPVQTRLNGEDVQFLCDPGESLLEALRYRLNLTGAKEGCNNGNCGACTVILDGNIVDSCIVLAAEVDGRDLMTIEGVAAGGQLHALQQAFLEEAALQCGVCTPGFIMAAKGLLDQEPKPDEHRIRHWLAGNLCRCTGYEKIVRAVLRASGQPVAPLP